MARHGLADAKADGVKECRISVSDYRELGPAKQVECDLRTRLSNAEHRGDPSSLTPEIHTAIVSNYRSMLSVRQ